MREHGLGGGRGKVCLRWDWEKQGWLMPQGKALSSHILKNESSREWLPAEAAMESYCQNILGRAGIEAAWTASRIYRDISTVVSWRSDIEGVSWQPAKRMEIPIGGAIEFDEVGAAQWARFAREGEVPAGLVFDAVREAAEKLPDALGDGAKYCKQHDAVEDPGALVGRIEAVRTEAVERSKKILREIGTRAASQERRVEEGQRMRTAKPMPGMPKPARVKLDA